MVSLLFLPRRRRGYLSTCFVVLVVLFHLEGTSSADVECYKGSGTYETDNYNSIVNANLQKATCQNVCIFALCVGVVKKWVQGCKNDVSDVCGGIEVGSKPGKFINDDDFKLISYTCEGDCRAKFFHKYKAAVQEKLPDFYEGMHWPKICSTHWYDINNQTFEVDKPIKASIGHFVFCAHSCVTAICQGNGFYWIDSCKGIVEENCHLKDNELKTALTTASDTCHTSSVDMINAIACDDEDCRQKFLKCLGEIYTNDKYKEDKLRSSYPHGFSYPGHVLTTTTQETPTSTVTPTTTEKTTTPQSEVTKTSENPGAKPTPNATEHPSNGSSKTPQHPEEAEINDENDQDEGTSDGNMGTPLNLFMSFIMIFLTYFFVLW